MKILREKKMNFMKILAVSAKCQQYFEELQNQFEHFTFHRTMKMYLDFYVCKNVP